MQGRSHVLKHINVRIELKLCENARLSTVNKY